ncbi:MAG: hypothetical protein EOM14_10975, partial [Clostridia bacterium]|nr:hypothetical protein [Clostridia bacterium]
MDNDMNDITKYVYDKLEEIDDFKLIIDNIGFKELKDVLNEEWFEKIREDGKLVWAGQKQEYCGEYFPFRWLYEDGQFTIMQSFKALYKESPKKAVLRDKIKRIATAHWKTNECSAIELSNIVKFFNCGILEEIEPLVNPAECKKKADASIKIDDRNILVEVSGFEKARLKNSVGTINLEINQKILIEKVVKKHEEQLHFANIPILLIIQRPRNCFVDQHQINWAVNDGLFAKIDHISALVFYDSYIPNNGISFINPISKIPLTNIEKDYI